MEMSKAYIVGFYREIRDPDKMADYVELGTPAVLANGGRVLARGDASGGVRNLEGGPNERTVIAEFESFEAAVAHYNSPAYQEAVAALGDGAIREMRIVQGVD
jgi:uncharacterized protein (DUF1330 family)